MTSLPGENTMAIAPDGHRDDVGSGVLILVAGHCTGIVGVSIVNRAIAPVKREIGEVITVADQQRIVITRAYLVASAERSIRNCK
jgi:hypothetical protein